ncbi:MAG: class I SAM-dependent methyltransferase [Dehalococcoidales bacterium]|nr:class I SAM-dependent methyltransferase [Dehalococcoidales bacterium]
MKVHESYNQERNDGVPVADHSHNLKKVTPWRRLLGHWAVRIFNDGVETLNQRAFAHMETNTGSTVIDLGTGDSKLFLYFNRKIQSQNLHAIDLTSNNIPGVRIFEGNLENRFPVSDNFYDAVISSQNIEHIIDVPLYCKEIRRILKPGGYAIILTENMASWVNIAALTLGWTPFSTTNMFGKPLGNPMVWHAELHNDKDFEEAYNNRYWGALGHQRVFTLKALKQLFTDRGFEIECSFSGGYAVFTGLLQSILSFLDNTHSQFIGIKIRKKS